MSGPAHVNHSESRGSGAIRVDDHTITVWGM